MFNKGDSNHYAVLLIKPVHAESEVVLLGAEVYVGGELVQDASLAGVHRAKIIRYIDIEIEVKAVGFYNALLKIRLNGPLSAGLEITKLTVPMVPRPPSEAAAE